MDPVRFETVIRTLGSIILSCAELDGRPGPVPVEDLVINTLSTPVEGLSAAPALLACDLLLASAPFAIPVRPFRQSGMESPGDG